MIVELTNDWEKTEENFICGIAGRVDVSKSDNTPPPSSDFCKFSKFLNLSKVQVDSFAYRNKL